MKKLTLKDLKTKIENKVFSYNQSEGKLDFSISFGTKNVEIDIQIAEKRIIEVRGMPRERIYKTPLVKIAARLEDILFENAFVKFSSVISSNMRYSNPEGIQVSNETILAMAQCLIEYWKGYKKIKQLNALFLDSDFHPKELMNDFRVMALKDKDICKFTIYNKVIVKPERFNVSLVCLEEECQERITLVLQLQNELEQLLNEEKTFVMEKMEEEKFAYNVENMKFYFENAYFNIKTKDKMVVIEGEEIESFELSYGEGVGREILKGIEEQRRVFNLVHPPIRNIKELIGNQIYTKHSDDMYEKKIEEMDALVGIGKTEEECIEIIEIFAKYKDTKRYEMWITKGKFKSSKNDDFQYYCVKTEKYFWHILIDKGIEFWMYPSDSDEYPEYIHEALFEVMKRNMKKN
ncbi:hypothetical protein [Bacillus thuringiensis]|uniref:hypothetical protein n=1 Tax=Bacillus thuringiensis TaxID=1428 RepID=UPI0021D65B7E|nr:hypothetical protein [Bacillus thuringiensis]MCU7667151.1 hypothetical protein [Bacillus thuringiensis]